MNVTEANELVQKLLVYQGKVMQPLQAPVKDFLIVPAGQKEFDQMFSDMTANKTSFQTALTPFKDNVTILVCFDSVQQGSAFCQYDSFLSSNGIHTA